MASPPAWSMGTSQRGGLRSNGNPGPGSYNSLNKGTTPGWRIGSASRSVDRKNETPGPGSYNSPGKISTTSPRYGFGVKSPHALISETPGPGTYDANALRSFEHKGPSYSMRPKTASIDGKTKIPGPGSYDQNSRILNQTSPSFKVGTARRDGLYASSSTPGPGMYALRPASAYNKESGPKFGFGTQSRDHIHDMSKTLPGPGTYDFRGTFESPGKGMSLVPRRPDSAIFTAGRSPGPGAYNPNLSTKNSPPAYRIGSASRSGLSKEMMGIPGPGSYEPKLAQKNSNIKIGTSQRSPLSISGNAPGPGTYEYSTKVGEGPKFIMNPRRDDVAKTQQTRYIPGPGAYNPSVELVKDKGPNIKMGTSSRSDLYDSKANPGPGQYDVRGRLAGPRWGFGSEQRGKEYKSGIPGPGSYDLPSKVGDVPRYAYGNAPLKIHM